MGKYKRSSQACMHTFRLGLTLCLLGLTLCLYARFNLMPNSLYGGFEEIVTSGTILAFPFKDDVVSMDP